MDGSTSPKLSTQYLNDSDPVVKINNAMKTMQKSFDTCYENLLRLIILNHDSDVQLQTTTTIISAIMAICEKQNEKIARIQQVANTDFHSMEILNKNNKESNNNIDYVRIAAALDAKQNMVDKSAKVREAIAIHKETKNIVNNKKENTDQSIESIKENDTSQCIVS